MSLQAMYGDWRLYNDLMVDAIRAMPPRELALRAGQADGATSASWPIWAIAAHTAGTRVYWLCTVVGLPGAAMTPFGADGGVGWEDDLAHPRSAEELVTAWTTTWRIVERALEGWTLEMLDEPVARGEGAGTVHFTRRSLLLRMITHEGFHAGQIAVIQAIHGLPQLDLWPPHFHTIEAAAAAREPR